MSEHPLYVDDLSPHDQTLLQESHDYLVNNFNVEQHFLEHFKFSFFECGRHSHDLSVRESFLINQLQLPAYVIFAYSVYEVRGTRGVHNHGEFQPWGYVKMAHDFGHVYIRHESLVDKVVELVQRKELDFPNDKKFSSRFYVLAKEELKAQTAISEGFRNVLINTTLKNFFIEIKGTELLVAVKNELRPELIKSTVELITDLAKLR